MASSSMPTPRTTTARYGGHGWGISRRRLAGAVCSPPKSSPRAACGPWTWARRTAVSSGIWTSVGPWTGLSGARRSRYGRISSRTLPRTTPPTHSRTAAATAQAPITSTTRRWLQKYLQPSIAAWPGPCKTQMSPVSPQRHGTQVSSVANSARPVPRPRSPSVRPMMERVGGVGTAGSGGARACCSARSTRSGGAIDSCICTTRRWAGWPLPAATRPGRRRWAATLAASPPSPLASGPTLWPSTGQTGRSVCTSTGSRARCAEAGRVGPGVPPQWYPRRYGSTDAGARPDS